MGRDLTKIMILENSPHSYAFNPENDIPCETWFNDYEDTELRDLISVFEVRRPIFLFILSLHKHFLPYPDFTHFQSYLSSIVWLSVYFLSSITVLSLLVHFVGISIA